MHIDQAAGLMQTPLKIPFSFLSQEYSIALPRKNVSVFHISPISVFLNYYLFFNSCSGSRHRELPKKRVLISSAAFHVSVQGPPPSLTTFTEHNTVAAGLHNPSQMAGKANSLAVRFLFQPFKR